MKTENTHTPGPWTFHGSSINATIDGETVQVASMNRTRWGGNLTERERNLHTQHANAEEADRALIAAAPELLEALKVIAERYESYQDTGTTQDMAAAAYDMRCLARAAIAKATKDGK